MTIEGFSKGAIPELGDGLTLASGVASKRRSQRDDVGGAAICGARHIIHSYIRP
jgi:hypothetical protein